MQCPLLYWLQLPYIYIKWSASNITLLLYNYQHQHMMTTFARAKTVLITGGSFTIHDTDGHGGRSEEGALNPPRLNALEIDNF